MPYSYPLPNTLVSALQNLPRREGRGYRFIASDGKEHFYLWEELWQEANRRGAHLTALGLAKGDRVALVIPEGHEFVLSFLGAVVAGIVPVPIYPRATFKAIDSYADTVAHICAAAEARVLLTMEATKPFVEKVLDRDVGVQTVTTTEVAFAGETPAFARPEVTPGDLCFLQFTSGSTSRPKGVMVTHANLVANAAAFLGPPGLDRRDEDVGVSWLPLYHDMGLIGFILGPLVCDINIVVMPTAAFARAPRIWLETIHRLQGTLTYAPNFAYALVTKRLKDRDLAELNLSRVRIAGCGAEPIRGQTLLDFAEKLRPTGFDATALLPSYGMAEATLAITFHPRATPMVIDRVDAEAMKRGEAVPVQGDARALELVSNGVSFPGHEVAIVDEAGTPLPERKVGEIVTRGPSVTVGYHHNEEATKAAWRNGWLHTGDLGYLAGGNLYVCGRIKDLIILRGANYAPQDLEWAVDAIEGVRRGNVVAFSLLQDGTEQLVICAEGNSGDAARLRSEIAAKINQDFGLAPQHVAIVPVGTLPKTSSGKAQRRKTREMFERAELNEHP